MKTIKEVKKVRKEKIEKEVEKPKVLTEREQLEVRHKELSEHYAWLHTNSIRDIGQLEVILSQVNQRLLEV